MDPLCVLFDDTDGPALPAALHDTYGSGLGWDQTCLISNFVQSIDGVVAISGVPDVAGMISGRSPADRFVMGLLRACADAVLISGSMLGATRNYRWIPATVDAEHAGEFAELRQRDGRTPEPVLVVIAPSGDVDPAHPALAVESILATTAGGAKRAAGLPATCRVEVCGEDQIDLAALVAALHGSGLAVLLSEAGPASTAELLRADLVDELFLTVAPVIAGGGHDRRGFADGAGLLPDRRRALTLGSVRSAEDLLFLRYLRQRVGGFTR